MVTKDGAVATGALFLRCNRRYRTRLSLLKSGTRTIARQQSSTPKETRQILEKPLHFTICVQEPQQMRWTGQKMLQTALTRYTTRFHFCGYLNWISSSTWRHKGTLGQILVHGTTRSKAVYILQRPLFLFVLNVHNLVRTLILPPIDHLIFCPILSALTHLHTWPPPALFPSFLSSLHSPLPSLFQLMDGNKILPADHYNPFTALTALDWCLRDVSRVLVGVFPAKPYAAFCADSKGWYIGDFCQIGQKGLPANWQTRLLTRPHSLPFVQAEYSNSCHAL